MKKMLLMACVALTFTAFAQTKLFPVEIKGKSGYMDVLGKMTIPAVYDYADDFINGFAVVALRNLPCVINEKNRRVVDTGLYQFISPFSEGLAAARDFRNRKFYIDTNGTRVITLPDSIYELRKFRNGLACVSRQLDQHTLKFNHDIVTLGYRFGYIDRKGNYAIDLVYEDADDFSEGVARVKTRDKFGLIDVSGKWVLNPEYGNIAHFNEGLAVIDAGGKYGYVDPKGTIVIAPRFDLAFDFSQGMAAVWNSSTKKYGFIDQTGALKIPADYDDVMPFSEEKAAVFREGKWGFIDKTGTLVLRHVFDQATVFSEGLCAVLVKKKWGFIDGSGRLVIAADLDAVGSFKDGVADVVYRGISLYMNRNGDILPKLEK